MPSIISGYNYDIFISYRQKDNKGDRWVSEFVDSLKTELESTFKEEISVYFDINPHDGLLETHDVDASLKDKLKCLVFIPIISRTYCDPKSFAWEHEFKSFIEQASQDQFGLKLKLPNGNVASRVLPVRIYDLDSADNKLCESVLGGVLRGVDFIYKSPGVNRPLLLREESPQDNLNHTNYRDQINKVSNAIKEIIYCLIPEPEKQVDLGQSQAIEPQVFRKPELDHKAGKSKRTYFTKYFFNRIPFIKRFIIPILSLFILLLIIIIIGLLNLLKFNKVNYGTTATYSNIPVESVLMDRTGQYPLFDISPDGTTIAYCSDKGIQIKSLSNFSTKILEGTLAATQIEFSPDGQFLAFSKGGINKIGISGSPISVVCKQGGICLSWGTDGNIYFSRGLGSEGIWRVSANGGEAEQLTYIIDSLGENAHTWPQLLSDTKTLLYTSLGPSTGSIDSKIVIQQLDTKERKVLVNNAIFGRYLSNGNLLYANNEGNIFILTFNLRKLKIVSDPEAVLSGVNTSTWSGAAFLSVSETGNLIFLPRIESPLSDYEVVDRSGQTIIEDSITLETLEMLGHGWSDLKMSPFGNYIAITGRTYGSTDIWLLNLESKNGERITFEPSEDEYAVWSPDGKYIAYTSSMAGTNRKILIQDLSIRGNPKHVLTWPRHIHLTDWSPDGKWFVALDYSSNNGMDLYAISINSNEIIPISTTQANEGSGQFSPDGKWLTYTSDQSGSTETYIVTFPELERKQQFLTGGKTGLSWGQSGKIIYFRDGDYLYAQKIDISNEIIKEKPVKLFQTQFMEFEVSPDGQKFYLRRININRPNPPLYLITNWFQELETKIDY